MPDGGRVLYRHATLVDGSATPARADMDVLVSGQRIEAVFADTPDLPASAAKARVVDLQGRYLMPGFVDSHVHLATPPNRRQAEAEMRRNLYGGVTTVRDMADDLRVASDLARASGTAPSASRARGPAGRRGDPLRHARLRQGRGPRAASATSAASLPGKLADMVVLEKDPMSSVDNLKSVVMTIKRCRAFPRSDFIPLQDEDIVDFN